MRNTTKSTSTKLLLVVVAVWCVLMPFFWAYNVDKSIDPGLQKRYWEILASFLPELVTGVVFLLCLPLVFLRPSLAAVGFAFAAVLLPVLCYVHGSPENVWPVSTALLVILAWRLYVHNAKQGS